MDVKTMKRLGFSPKQIVYLTESVEKAVVNVLNESLEKGFVTSLAVCLNILMDSVWTAEEAKTEAPEFVERALGLWEAMIATDDKGHPVVNWDDICGYVESVSGIKIEWKYLNYSGVSGRDMIKGVKE